MANAVIHLQGSYNPNGTEQVKVPLRVLDNSDNTYSLAVGGLINTITSPDKETPHVAFRCIQEFTGVNIGQTVICAAIIDVITPTTAPIFKWINLQSGEYITPPAVEFESYLQYIGGNSLTLAQLSTAGLATELKQDALIASQSLNYTAEQHIAVATTSSTLSAAVSAATKTVTLVSNVDCWIGINKTATPSVAVGAGIYLAAGVISPPFAVTGGISKVRVLGDVVDGYLTIFESA